MNYISTLVDPIDRLPGVSKEELRGLLNLIQGIHTAGIAGGIIEMGCAQGHTTTYFRRLLDHLGSDRELHVADAFQGLPEKRPEDGSDPTFVQGTFAGLTKEGLLKTFKDAGLRPPVIHIGWFGEIMDYPGVIAFAFLDGDFHKSIEDSLGVIWPRMPSGGVIALHDYHFTSLPGAAAALHEFIDPRGILLRWTGDEGIPYIVKP